MPTRSQAHLTRMGRPTSGGYLPGGSTDVTPPLITSSPIQTVAENTVFSMTLTANEPVTWSKVGGADQAGFNLTGAMLSMNSRNFEAPADADLDNVYIVIVRATDAAGNGSNLTIGVTVTDVVELSTFSDDFNRADGNLANANWTMVSGVATEFQIKANQLSIIHTADSVIMCPTQGSPNHWAEARVAKLQGAGAFICNRLVDIDNYFGFRWDNTVIEIISRQAGSFNFVNLGAGTVVVGDLLRVECQGTTWRLLKNGAQLIGFTNTGLSGLNSARQGLVGRSVTFDPWIDDFKVGAL